MPALPCLSPVYVPFLKDWAKLSVGLSLDSKIRCRSGAAGTCPGCRLGGGTLSSGALVFSCTGWENRCPDSVFMGSTLRGSAENTALSVGSCGLVTEVTRGPGRLTGRVGI